MADAKIGLVGLDTSHVTAFTKLLNDPSVPHHVPGARVTVAYAGGSPDFEPSRGRVEGFTKELREQWGVSILSSPQEVAKEADVVFVTAVDSRTHLEYVRDVVSAGKPLFIDKPFAQTLSDAQEMVSLAQRQNVAITGGSSVRYAGKLTALLADDDLGRVTGCDVFGPMDVNDIMPGLLWYGCHGIDVLQRAMGACAASVSVEVSDQADVYTYVFPDGRVATYRGVRGAHHQFGITIHRENGFQQSTLQPGPDEPPWYAAMLAAILGPLRRNEAALDTGDVLAVMQMIEMGNIERSSAA